MPQIATSRAATLALALVLVASVACAQAPAAAPTSGGAAAAPTTAAAVAPTTAAAATSAPAATAAATSAAAPTSAAPTTAAAAATTPAAAPTTAAAATTAPAATTAAGAAGGQIVIGGSVPLSGDASIAGIPFYNAAKMAIEEWNAKGGVLGKQVSLNLEDDACDPKQAATVTPKVIATPNLDFVLNGICSGATLAAGPLYNQAGLPQIAANSNPKLTQQGWTNFFRFSADDNLQGGLMADVAVSHFGVKKWAVYHDQQAFGKGVAEVFSNRVKELGGEIVSSGGVDPKDLDYSAVLTTVAASNPDGFYFATNLGPVAGRLVKQARDLGYKWQMAGPDGTFTTDFITTGTPAATEGFLSSFGAPPADSTPELRAFYDKYKAKFGKDPDPAAVSGYDMINVMLSAVQKAGSTDKKAVIDTLHNTQFSTTVFKNVRFDQKGDIDNPPMTIYQVKNGKFEVVAIYADHQFSYKP